MTYSPPVSLAETWSESVGSYPATFPDPVNTPPSANLGISPPPDLFAGWYLSYTST